MFWLHFSYVLDSYCVDLCYELVPLVVNCDVITCVRCHPGHSNYYFYLAGINIVHAICGIVFCANDAMTSFNEMMARFNLWLDERYDNEDDEDVANENENENEGGN